MAGGDLRDPGHFGRRQAGRGFGGHGLDEVRDRGCVGRVGQAGRVEVQPDVPGPTGAGPPQDRRNRSRSRLTALKRGNPYDNPKAESFMKTLKIEAVYVTEYETFEPGFIDNIYNATRLHSGLGYLSPVQFEERNAPARTNQAA